MTERRIIQELQDRIAELESRNEHLATEAVKYRTLFDSFPHGITVSDGNGNILETNTVSEQLLGVSKNEHEARAIDGREWRIIRTDGTEMPVDEWASVIALKEKRTVSGCEMGIARPDGKVTWISVSATPLPLKGHGVVITYSDITQKKESEKKLLESEKRLRESRAELRRTLEATTDGIWTWNFKTNELFFSHRYYTMLGYAPDAFPADYENWVKLIHPDDLDDALAAAERYLKTKPDRYENEFRLKTRDGDYRWIRTRAKVVERDRNGDAVYMIGNHEDITDWKKQEEMLHLQSLVLDQIHDNVTITDLNGVISYVNQAVAKSLGRDKETLTGQPTRIYSENPDKGAAQKEIIQNTLRNGKWRGEVVNFDQQGREHVMDCRTQVIYNKQGVPVALCGIATDVTRKKASEKALRESETKFRTLFQQAAVGVALVSPNGCFLAVNDKFCEITGYAEEELLRLSFRDITHPDDLHIDDNQITRIVSGETDHFEIEKRYIHKSGRHVWIKLYSNAVRNQDGSVKDAIAVIADITRQKYMESRLKQDEQRFRQIYENMAIGVARVSLDFFIEGANQAYCDMLGYRETELIGKHLKDITHADTIEANLRKQSRLARCEIDHYRMDKRFVHKNGNVVHGILDANLVRDSNGKPLYFIGTVLDITARKQAEENLRTSQERFLKVLDSIDANVYVADLDTHEILFMNQHMKDSFGRDMTGDICWKAFRNETGPCPHCTNDRLMNADGEPTGVHVWKDQNPVTGKHYVNHDRAIEWTDGRLVRLQIATDISNLVKMEAQLQQSRKMESIGRLAGGVAHDFNNMLSVISGNTEMILEDLHPQDPIIANLREIEKAARRSADFTRQLLGFARKQTVAPKVLDLNETIDGMLKMLRRLIGEDIDLAWMPDRNLWRVKMDPSQVDQVLANLCVNARDAIRGNGRLTIETGNVRFDDEYCREHEGFKHGDHVMLAVSDSGVGMTRETLDKIFEPFFTTKDVGKGTGLGLATVYGIVKQNDGFINVYSEVGKGTVFRIYFPRYIATDARPRNRIVLDKDTGGSETVLLVEDETGILRMTTMMLERLGYRVLAASGAVEAVRIAESYPGAIDILMTDVVMPEMSGRTVAEKLMRSHPRIRCLFMSGYTANVIAHHGVLDEGVHFINKPFSKQDLAVKIREILDASDDLA